MEHKILTPEQCRAKAPNSTHHQFGGCNICDGGLSLCTVCGGLEGSLAKECPGVKTSMQQLDKVYGRQVEFMDGKWVELKACSLCKGLGYTSTDPHNRELCQCFHGIAWKREPA